MDNDTFKDLTGPTRHLSAVELAERMVKFTESVKSMSKEEIKELVKNMVGAVDELSFAMEQLAVAQFQSMTLQHLDPSLSGKRGFMCRHAIICPPSPVKEDELSLDITHKTGSSFTEKLTSFYDRASALFRNSLPKATLVMDKAGIGNFFQAAAKDFVDGGDHARLLTFISAEWISNGVHHDAKDCKVIHVVECTFLQEGAQPHKVYRMFLTTELRVVLDNPEGTRVINDIIRGQTF
jgi:hypothetical protein